MNKQEYMEQLRKKLRRLPKEDFERAVEYYEEYFADAGVENEAKAIQDLGTPQETAEQIIRDMALDYSKEPAMGVKKGLHGLWVMFLAVCVAPLALPLLFTGILVIGAAGLAIASVLFAALLVAACSVLMGPLMVVAGFTILNKSLPVFITCVGFGLMTTGIGAALTYGMYLLCRKFLVWSIRGFAKMIRKGGKKHV